MTEFVDDFIDSSPGYSCIQVIYLRETLTLSIHSTSLIHIPSYPANGRALGDLHWKFRYQSRNHITYLKSPGSRMNNIKNNSFKYFYPRTTASLQGWVLQGWVLQLLGSAASHVETCRGAFITMIKNCSGQGIPWQCSSPCTLCSQPELRRSTAPPAALLGHRMHHLQTRQQNAPGSQVSSPNTSTLALELLTMVFRT